MLWKRVKRKILTFEICRPERVAEKEAITSKTSNVTAYTYSFGIF